MKQFLMLVLLILTITGFTYESYANEATGQHVGAGGSRGGTGRAAGGYKEYTNKKKDDKGREQESAQDKLRKDYSYVTTDNYEIYDKELNMKREIIDFEKQELINKIQDENLKLSKIKPNGTYYTAGKYPFYDGAAFFDSVSAQHVLSGIPSMSSGGMLENKDNKLTEIKEVENPFEIGKYQRSYKGYGRYVSSPATAYF